MNDNADIKNFLLVLSISSGSIEVREFGSDMDEALAAYAAAEESTKDDPDKDVVLVGADSLETVKRTHSSYFAAERTSRLFDELIEEGFSYVAK